MRRVFQALSRGSDRAAALIAAAGLDTALEDAIASEWIHLDGKDREMLFSPIGPLSSFVVKVRIAHAMGIFGDITRSDLIEISQIRNGFAHSSKPWTFSLEPLASECRGLQVPAAYSAFKDQKLPSGIYRDPTHPRGIFVNTCLMITFVLMRHTLREMERLDAYVENLMAPLDAGEVTGAQMNAWLAQKTRTVPP